MELLVTTMVFKDTGWPGSRRSRTTSSVGPVCSSIFCLDKQKVNRVLSISLLDTYLGSHADTPPRPLTVASISFLFLLKKTRPCIISSASLEKK
jgi:hypothetical protein